MKYRIKYSVHGQKCLIEDDDWQRFCDRLKLIVEHGDTVKVNAIGVGKTFGGGDGSSARL